MYLTLAHAHYMYIRDSRFNDNRYDYLTVAPRHSWVYKI